ncbi:hypothetical protein [Planktothricoides raciborskii]|uniref:Uncharacterized protein n=1 Tax=Planktothricoides raciborskii GIHE-MW2 TaxID=2792601 RepID=A0AAU8JIW0_9CYAN
MSPERAIAFLWGAIAFLWGAIAFGGRSLLRGRSLFWGAIAFFRDMRNRVSLYNLCHPTNILIETRFLGRGDRLAEDEEIAFSVNMAKNDKNCHNIPKR